MKKSISKGESIWFMDELPGIATVPSYEAMGWNSVVASVEKDKRGHN